MNSIKRTNFILPNDEEEKIFSQKIPKIFKKIKIKIKIKNQKKSANLSIHALLFKRVGASRFSARWMGQFFRIFGFVETSIV